MRRMVPLIVLAVASAGVPACDAYSVDDSPRVGTAVSGLERYRALSVAVAEGYEVDMTHRQTDYFVPGKGIEIKNAVLRGDFAPIALLSEVLATASQSVIVRYWRN